MTFEPSTIVLPGKAKTEARAPLPLGIAGSHDRSDPLRLVS